MKQMCVFMSIQKLIVQCREENAFEITAKLHPSVKMSSYFIHDYRPTFVQLFIVKCVGK